MSDVSYILRDGLLVRLPEELFIPADIKNSEYVEYKKWLDAGHSPSIVTSPVTQGNNEQAIQLALDAKAQERNYSDIKSACSYAAASPCVPESDEHFATCEKFRLEGNALQAWMSLTWATAYAYIVTVQAGTNPMPTPEEAVAMMPEFTWPD